MFDQLACSVYRKCRSFASLLFARFRNLKRFIKEVFLLFDELVGLLYLIFITEKSENKNNHVRPVVAICRYNMYGNGKDVSMEKYHLENTLQNFDVEIKSYIWDNLTLIGLNKIRFIKFLQKESPDVVVLSSYSPSPKRLLSQPGNFLLRRIKSKKLLPNCIAIWWDTCSDGFAKVNIKSNNPIDLHVVIDNPAKNFNYTGMSESDRQKLLFLYCPYNINCLFRPQAKTIDFCFLGQINSYRNNRKEYIDYLIRNKVQGYLGTDDRLNQVSHNEYAEILGKAKIGLNFSYSVDRHQLKSRVFEVLLSGALLLETKNDQTSVLFEEGKDFVSFTTKEDLLEKIQYYLHNEEECAKIAQNGREKVIEKYNGVLFWKQIFTNIRFDV